MDFLADTSCTLIAAAGPAPSALGTGMVIIVLVTILVALVFDFLNGFHDAANSIATVVSTRVLSPRQAVAWAAFFNFVAAFVFGTHVAKTIGTGLVETALVDVYVVCGGLQAADAFCRRTNPWERIRGKDVWRSLDEHTVPRWTKMFSIRKGYVTTPLRERTFFRGAKDDTCFANDAALTAASENR